MKILGYLCYAFGVIDFLGMFLGYDLTGVSWSPIVAACVGSLFLYFGKRKKDAENSEEE